MKKAAVIVLIIFAVGLFSFGRRRSPEVYIGEIFQGETGKSAPVIMFDRHKNVYYSSSEMLESVDSIADRMRTYTSRTVAIKRHDSVFISFDSIVKTYTVMEAFVFGEQRKFIELHYDTLHKVKIRGKMYPDYFDATLTEIKIGVDTAMTKRMYRRYE